MIRLRTSGISVEKGALYSVHLTEDGVKALLSCAAYEPSFHNRINDEIKRGVFLFGRMKTVYLIADSFEEAEVNGRYIFEEHER